MTNETKSLEIIIVEDNPKHLIDAQTEVQRVIRAGIPISASYAQTYEEARVLMSKIKFKGTICDVFFPYDTQTRNGKISGWNPDAARRCYEALCNFSGLNTESKAAFDWTINWLDDYRKIGTSLEGVPRDEIPQWVIDGGGKPVTAKMYQEAQRWQNGESMHPTGVIVAEEARYLRIPIVFCTDTNHHGSTTEPVCGYARQHGIHLVDATPQDLGKNWRGASANSKHWDQAVHSLLVAMVVGEQLPNLPRYDHGDRELDVQKSIPLLEPHLRGYNLPKELIERVVYSMQKWTK